MAVVKECLENNIKWFNEYGTKTVVLTQIGQFFEQYTLLNEDGSYSSKVFQEFITICDLLIGKKNMTIDGKQLLMAGFGVAQLDKYVRKLQEHDYTIVIYQQDDNGKNTTRSLVEIISPGTFFGKETQELSNNIMSIWLHRSNRNTSKYFAKQQQNQQQQITIGVAIIDIFTGKTSLFQFNVEDNSNPLTYDELERYVSAYKPSEALIVSNIKEQQINDIISFVGLNECRKIHKVDLSNSNSNSTTMMQCAINAEKQKYQKEIFNRFYSTMSETALMESFSTHYIATQAFCLLLDFVYQHSPNLVRKLMIPVYENHTDKLFLANHSLRQLNIIDDERHKGKLSSVSSLLNNCVTTMGKRSFMYHLYNPSTNIKILNESYAITEHLLHHEEVYTLIRKKLSSIKDVEKMCRKIVMGKIMPKDFAHLANDLFTIGELFLALKEDSVLAEYIKNQQQASSKTDIATLCGDIIADLKHTFDLERCAQLGDINKNNLLELEAENVVFINKGISSTIDTLTENSLESREKLEAIRNYFSNIIKTKEKSKANVVDYIKIHETPKTDAVLIGTSRRVALLKSELSKLVDVNKSNVVISYKSDGSKQIELSLKDLMYESIGSNKKDLIITSPQIKQITSSVQNSKDKLVQELEMVFSSYVVDFLKFEKHLETIKNYIIILDMLQCKCYIANKYNYCKPTIVDKNESKAFVNFTSIRHPLIEHIQTNELYVTNDLAIGGGYAPLPPLGSTGGGVAPLPPLGYAPLGLLLFGTNAVGKTSFIKSVGIAVIMAQAGLYVPCSTFEYKPYSYIFTRILGNDNLFKGLSTFAVEMSELRTILNQADENSLVLGDELCSGTESDSALSIFTAGLEHLHAKKSTFLFATHFHEIVKYDEIKALDKLAMKHMAVLYDKEHGLLVYDRKLHDGPGESNYGIQVCRSLNLPDDFLLRADEIRMKYNKSTKNILSLDSSHFNAQKIVANCDICKMEKATEVHHLQHQKNANKKNNYIGSFHKNHTANLSNICESCHKKMHASDKEHEIKKTINGTTILQEKLKVKS